MPRSGVLRSESSRLSRARFVVQVLEAGLNMIRKEEKRYEKQYTNTHREHPVEHGAPCRPCACRRTGGRDTEGHWAESAIERWSG